tara:strand:- start:239 stop:523 length:285 start_codon:yes stop_codon:yes gene_type:complete
MKVTKSYIKQLVKEELNIVLNEEEEKAVVRNYKSNSGESRYYVKIGHDYYQTREEIAKDIQQNGYDRKKHDSELSKIKPGTANYDNVSQKMRNI